MSPFRSALVLFTSLVAVSALHAQGAGNVVAPFFGGIAAVIRTICESELSERYEFVSFDTTLQRFDRSSALRLGQDSLAS